MKKSKISPEHISLKRPQPLTVPRLKQSMNHLEITKFLLNECLNRYEEARQMETSREIIYPETSVIFRDINRLSLQYEAMKSKTAKPEVKPGKRF